MHDVLHLVSLLFMAMVDPYSSFLKLNYSLYSSAQNKFLLWHDFNTSMQFGKPVYLRVHWTVKKPLKTPNLLLLKEKRRNQVQEPKSCNCHLLNKYLTIEIKYTLSMSVPVAEMTSLPIESTKFNVRHLWLLESCMQWVGVCACTLLIVYLASSCVFLNIAQCL